ncbi:hypothetical protein AA0111_g2178 [Alternaria arborescens]|uniref:hypothetical protein n=1 Tax=Alternaria arborescens TaxID=156630 RepID=UPI0010750634|nr:hypothetical protein AA0111_g2178 [Alternaria arborescens]RYO37781.1 hypothetical protein AA0111_g2178 [Alternaria arborescens]
MKQCSSKSAKPETNLSQFSAKVRQRIRVDYQSSVDVDNPVQVDHIANTKWKRGQLCWEAKGTCAQDYKNKETELMKELNQSRRESFSEVAVSLFMVGKTPQKAKPMIIISSEDKRSREEAERAIKNSGILKDLNYEIGFLKYLPSGPIHAVARSSSEGSGDSIADSSFSRPGRLDSENREDTKSILPSQPGVPVSKTAYYDPEQRLQTTAMSIHVNTATKKSRMATGNLIYNGATYKYLTVAHVFSPWNRDSPSIDSGIDDLGIPFDSDSEEEEECNEKTSYTAGTTPVSLKVPVTASAMPYGSLDIANDPPSGLLRLGELSTDEDLDISTDCAIITINDSKIQQELVDLASSNREKDAQLHAVEPKSSPVTTWTRRGPISGTLRTVPKIMSLSGSERFQLIHELAHEGVIENGDSGSLVSDKAGRELYGMIIATSKNRSIAYVMAAKELMSSIANAGGWRIMSPRNDHSDTNQSREAIASQTEYEPNSTVLNEDTSMWDVYELPDSSFRVRNQAFFIEGRMFAMLFNEAVEDDSADLLTNHYGDVTGLYQSTRVKHSDIAPAQVRIFIVVKRKRDFCYAVPVSTYGNLATTKPGVWPEAHAIAYSYGCDPQLVAGEQALQKLPIAVQMARNEKPLEVASRIYFGIHYPIQYGVKAKDLGCVHPDWIARFTEYWKMENEDVFKNGPEVIDDPKGQDAD